MTFHHPKLGIPLREVREVGGEKRIHKNFHDEWLIPQILEVVRGLQEVVRRLEGKVEVLEEVVRRQGEKIRRLRQRPPITETRNILCL